MRASASKKRDERPSRELQAAKKRLARAERKLERIDRERKAKTERRSAMRLVHAMGKLVKDFFQEAAE